MKINMAVVVFPDKHLIGTRCVARDHAGTFIARELSRSVGVDDVVLAEFPWHLRGIELDKR